jgi:hypothetical protein
MVVFEKKKLLKLSGYLKNVMNKKKRIFNQLKAYDMINFDLIRLKTLNFES